MIDGCIFPVYFTHAVLNCALILMSLHELILTAEHFLLQPIDLIFMQKNNHSSKELRSNTFVYI
jgi:hypothetical protein